LPRQHCLTGGHPHAAAQVRASNWPHLLATPEAVHDDAALLNRAQGGKRRKRVLVDNTAALYRF